jgi:hypothetical protein
MRRKFDLRDVCTSTAKSPCHLHARRGLRPQEQGQQFSMPAWVFFGLGEFEGIQNHIARCNSVRRLFNPGANLSNSFRPK